MNYEADEELQYFQVVRQQLSQPMVVLRVLLINKDLRYRIYVARHLVSPQSSTLNSKLPSIVTADAVIPMINALHVANICQGNFDDQFIDLAYKKKGKFLSCNGQLTAYLDESFCFEADGMTLASTIRHANCEILVDNKVCCHCAKFRNTLRALTWKLKSVSGVLSLHTNIRFLRTPQKIARFEAVRKAIKNKNKQLQRLKMKLSRAVKTDGIFVDDELSSDLQQVVDSKADHEPVFGNDEFKRIFWDQQVPIHAIYVYKVLITVDNLLMLGCCM